MVGGGVGTDGAEFSDSGASYNKGKVLKCLLDLGMEPIIDARAGHMFAIDGRSPKFDGGIETRLDCVSLGIVVNNRGERFYDEGEDFWPKRYATWGRLVAEQPDRVGYCFIDSKAMGKFMPTPFPTFKADTIGDLAGMLKLPVD